MKAKIVTVTALFVLPVLAWVVALTQYRETHPAQDVSQPAASAVVPGAVTPAAIDLPETRLVGQIRRGTTSVWHVRQRAVRQHCFDHAPLQGGPKSVRVCVPAE